MTMTGWRRGATAATAAGLLALVQAGAALAASNGAPAAASAAPAHVPHADASVAGSMSDTSPAQQLAAALQQMHLTACSGQVQRAAEYLFDGQPAQFVAQPLGPDADRWPTVFTIETADPTGGGHNRFATLVIAPGCSGMYEQTIYWPEPCATVKATVFAKFTGEHPLFKQVQVSDANAALQVYLTPAGTGCVSVKKELFR